MKAFQNLKNAVIPAAMVALSSPAFAAAVEVTEVVSDIKAQIGPITSIGGGVLLVMVGISAFRWVRKALF